MILDDIANYTKKRLEKEQVEISFTQMKKLALEKLNSPSSSTSHIQPFAFEKALREERPAIISEVKKASPSKGIISPDFPYLDIAKQYEENGATCISVLTEPNWFLGSNEIFQAIRKTVSLPMLRKDFVIDEYQIYQAKVLGADCVLLICALLPIETLKEYLTLCTHLGMSALVEAHDQAEIEMALQVGAKIIGVNNRNLKTFSVNLDNASQLAHCIPEDVIYIAESGIETPLDGIKQLNQGAHGLLIGEALMKTDNIRSFIQTIKNHPLSTQN